MKNKESKNNAIEENIEDIYESYPIDDDWEYILEETLDSGIHGLDMAYFCDKRVGKLVEPFKKAIYFMKAHTTLTEEQILDRINRTIQYVELKDGYKDNPNGIGYVDGIFNILSVNVKILEREPDEVDEFLRHEMTHMLGNILKRTFLRKEPILISGYSKENIFAKNAEKVKKINKSFNEASVEMFLYQDNSYKEHKIFGEIPIHTNQDFNEGYYCVNSNLIHQMILARGIEEQEFFEGLYNDNKAQKNVRKFSKRLFRKISENMDKITDDIDTYYDADDRIYDREQTGEKDPFLQDEKQKSNASKDFKRRVSELERIMVDKLLLPRLRKVSKNEKQILLDKYFQFIIFEKEYFKQKTGYQMIEKARKEGDSWFKHVDVEPLTRYNQRDDRIEEYNKDRAE